MGREMVRNGERRKLNSPARVFGVSGIRQIARDTPSSRVHRAGRFQVANLNVLLSQDSRVLATDSEGG